MSSTARKPRSTSDQPYGSTQNEIETLDDSPPSTTTRSARRIREDQVDANERTALLASSGRRQDAVIVAQEENGVEVRRRKPWISFLLLS